MRRTLRGSIYAALLLAGCHQKDAISDQQKANDVLTGDDHLAAATSPQCKLFSAAEAASYIGEPVGPPENAAMGSGCAWPAKDGEGEVMVVVLGADDHEPPTGSPDYHKLSAPGRDGFTIPQMDAWVAGAIVGDHAIRVTVMGKTASEASATKLLTDTASRLR
jgi:hypothetical protein